MKRPILLFFVLLMAAFAGSAQQRLAMLPFKVGGEAKSLCIDPLLNDPKGKTNYFNLDNPTQKGFYPSGHGNQRRFQFNRQEDGLTFWGPKNHPVDPAYRDFLDKTFKEFSNRFNSPDEDNYLLLGDLQYKIWAYSMMEKMGFIGHTGDVVLDFNNAIEQVMYKFDISPTLDKYSSIYYKLRQVYDEAVTRPLPKIAYQSCSQNGIVYTRDGIKKKLPIKYAPDDLNATVFLNGNPVQVKRSFLEYVRTYRRIPTEAAIVEDPKSIYVIILGSPTKYDPYNDQLKYPANNNYSGKLRFVLPGSYCTVND